MRRDPLAPPDSWITREPDFVGGPNPVDLDEDDSANRAEDEREDPDYQNPGRLGDDEDDDARIYAALDDQRGLDR